MKVYRPVAADIKISSPYGPRIDPLNKTEGEYHYGIDFAAPLGTPVVASISGPIFKAGYQNSEDHKQGFGLRVWQKAKLDGNEINVFYGHLSDIAVAEGEEVTAGTRIGLSGNSGASSGPHLHLEVRINNGKGIPIEFI